MWRVTKRTCANCGDQRRTTIGTCPYVCEDCSKTVATNLLAGKLPPQIQNKLSRNMQIGFGVGVFVTSALGAILVSFL